MDAVGTVRELLKLEEHRLENDPFVAHLEAMRKLLASASQSPRAVRVMMGNQAADLDSIVSSTVHAYAEQSSNSVRADVQCVPVMNVSAAEVRLRTEATFLFSLLGLDLASVTSTIDQFDLAGLKAQDRMELVLVDHNVCAPQQSDFEACVVGVIDHHVDECSAAMGVDGLEYLIVEPVGSCATLVYERLLQSQAAVSSIRLQLLILATILLDTANMDPSVGRATTKDSHVVDMLSHQLASKMGWSQVETAQFKDGLFAQVVRAKNNKSGLSRAELLMSDYKQYVMGSRSVGICSVLEPLTCFSEKDVLDFYNLKAPLDLVLVMASFKDTGGAFRRQLALFSFEDKELARILHANLAQSEHLILAPLETPMETEHGIYLEQRNLKLSRKILQPILQRVLETM
ncbi:Protein prune-like [Porphyridium purpureum]|uniref:Protein prune-like n=1 Tax=Porphyridium purpureum TaxID=35688 RepID=A0A5J4YU93_PORPP|nr:Protein prune-like [Porphyridium purpureum]|eukprot:POR1900..scf227_4